MHGEFNITDMLVNWLLLSTTQGLCARPWVDVCDGSNLLGLSSFERVLDQEYLHPLATKVLFSSVVSNVHAW